MFKWGRQGFFSKVDSRDDGFFKFSIKAARLEDSVDFDVKFMMADCQERIRLEFDPLHYYQNDDLGHWNECMAFLKARRKKAKVLRSAINDFCDAIDQAYDEYETRMRTVKPKK